MMSSVIKKALILITAPLLLTALSCTIVRHDNRDKDNGKEVTFYFEDDSFDASSYVDGIWDEKIIPEIQENANDLPELLRELESGGEKAREEYGVRKEETSPFNYIVKGRLPVKSIDTESSAGLLYLDLLDLSGEAFCAVQIGPVIKKSMVRDALTFIQFGDFSNQIEFANISREINFRIRETVVNRAAAELAPGDHVLIYGVFAWDDSGKVLITPVLLNRDSGNGNG